MKLARRIILHAPVSDKTLIADFVKQCLRDRVSLIAITGSECAKLEDELDWLIVENSSDSDELICTTSHSSEPLEDVIEFAQSWNVETSEGVQQVRL